MARRHTKQHAEMARRHTKQHAEIKTEMPDSTVCLETGIAVLGWADAVLTMNWTIVYRPTSHT